MEKCHPMGIQHLLWVKNCNYRPQRSFGKVKFSQACVILFTGGGMRGGRGPCVVAGGVHGCQGACMVAGGHVW